jgi:hypothetical protein
LNEYYNKKPQKQKQSDGLKESSQMLRIGCDIKGIDFYWFDQFIYHSFIQSLFSFLDSAFSCSSTFPPPNQNLQIFKLNVVIMTTIPQIPSPAAAGIKTLRSNGSVE